jgi:hypothetical protein
MTRSWIPQTCGECVFYHEFECRRFPPVSHPVLIDNQAWRYDHVFLYPAVGTSTPRCGEFQDRNPA